MKSRFRFAMTGLALLLLAGAVVWIATHLQVQTIERPVIAAGKATPGAVKVPQGPAELPDEKSFQTVGENDRLRLKLDRSTAHFLVEDKRDGRMWRSYPDPAQWSKETTGGLWRTNLRSPIMFQYADLSTNKSQPKESNLLEERGAIKDLQVFAGGFRLTFDIPSKELAIPIEVKLDGDSVVTRIIDSGIKEGSLSLIWVRLYPFFGAERSEGQDGYMFIPDGSGALIRFDPNSTNVNRVYDEPVYGTDLAFQINSIDFSSNSRHNISAPVYGLKNENRSFLAILEDGAEYADVIASPSGVYSTYNWITGEARYREKFRQITNREKNRSFDKINKEERFHADRTTRYVLLDSEASGYAGMARRYRSYLMDTYGLKPLPASRSNIPMDIIVVGGDTASGVLWDRYVKATDTSQATQMIRRLYGLGIANMTVRYWGWQKGGIGAYGGLSTVDSRLGGDKGMEDFVRFAHSLNIPVFLQTDYSRNTTGAGGFTSRAQGVRDMGGSPIDTFASLSFERGIVDQDIPYFRKLGVDGIELQGIGQFLNSDYNGKYGSSREQSLKLQQSIIANLRAGVGKVLGYRSSMYAALMSAEATSLDDDFSHDLFSSDGVPFLQIALHGLIPYTSVPSNDRDEFRLQFLHDLEYGASPSYMFASSSSDDLKYTKHLFFYSPAYKDWEQTAVQEYQEWNKALGDVQNRFITNHRIVTSDVRETTYAGGKRIVVNYGETPYTYEGKVVQPENYLIVQGGDSR